MVTSTRERARIEKGYPAGWPGIPSGELGRPGTLRPEPASLFRAVRRHRLAFIGALIVLFISGMALAAPLISPYDPNRQNLYQVLQKPSLAHWLGTDHLGRDLLSRVIYGARISLLVGLIAMLISATFGTWIGLIAGYRGGLLDVVLMRITDAFMCFPFLVFALALAAAMGPGINNIILALSLLGWTRFARIIRGQTLVVRELPYVEAGRASGMSDLKVMFYHVLPNAIPPIIVAASIFVGRAILTESGTAFLGLGIEFPTPSWGRELRIGYTYLQRVPVFSLAPGLMITLTVLAFNFLGDGLRDALDPHLRGVNRKTERNS